MHKAVNNKLQWLFVIDIWTKVYILILFFRLSPKDLNHYCISITV